MKSFTFLSFAVLPAAVFGHIGFFDKSVYGADAGYGHELATPLANMDFNRWWFHGNIDKKPSSVFELKAGGTATLELACNRKFTSMGGADGSNNDPCPTDTPSMHAGSPLQEKQLRGCGLAIAYKSDARDVDKNEMTVFTVKHDCVKTRFTTFEIPADMPECPDGKCICGWFWQGQNSANEMYMNGFDCKVTRDSPSSSKLATPKPAKFCRGNPENCVKGAKIAMYWANDVNAVGFDGSYERKPAYNEDWGFSDGAQNDIFVASDNTSPVPAPNPIKAPAPSEPEKPIPTTFSTRTRSSAAPVEPTPPAPVEPTSTKVGAAPTFNPTPGKPRNGNSPVTIVVKETATVYSTIYSTVTDASIAKPTGGFDNGAGANNCSWKGHCAGASCSRHEDCDGQLACVAGKCATPAFLKSKSMRYRHRHQ